MYLAVLLIVAGCLDAQQPAQPRSFYYLPLPGAPANVITLATDSLGQTLASAGLSDGRQQYVLLAGGNTQGLTIPPQSLVAQGLSGVWIYLTGLNELGQYVGYSSNGHGLMWSGATVLRIEYPGASSTFPRAVNVRGQIAGHASLTPIRAAGFLLDPTRGFLDVNVPGGPSMSAAPSALNNLGDVTGTYVNSENPRDTGAFILTRNQSVFYIDSGRVYDERGELTSLVAQNVMPLGINSSGEVVGTFYSGPASAARPFYYYGGLFQALDPAKQIGAADTKGFVVTGIDDNGEIYGYGGNGKSTFVFTGIAPSRPRVPWYDAVPAPSVPNGPTARGSQMNLGEVLHAGDSVTSPNGRYSLVYQGDSNLVLYRNYDRKPLWASNTAGAALGATRLDSDGHLRVYDRFAKAVFVTGAYPGTHLVIQYPGAHLSVQSDGNCVVYTPTGRPVWATDTVQ
jgi:hypothetical protein